MYAPVGHGVACSAGERMRPNYSGRPVPCKALLVSFLLLLLPTLALAKDKKDKGQTTLPAYVLQARTVAVLIDPEAGVSLDDPRANQVAQRDVETALLNWGRYQPTLSLQEADLIIVVRRGTGKLVSGTVHDPRQGNRPGVIEPTDTGIRIGVQQGREYPGSTRPGSYPGNASDGEMEQHPHPQATVGSPDDSFLVYAGRTETPLDAVPAWRYEEKDGLKPHNVPAVDEFRKAVKEAESHAKQP
jgi:hypothetical protein